MWGVLNFVFSPVFFRATRLPFLCDIIGLLALFSAIWAVRQVGTGTFVGLTATIVTFVMRPGAFYFLGFTVASILLDILVYYLGYSRVFGGETWLYILGLGVVTAATAGLIIGVFFMNFTTVIAILTWSLLHAVGGFIGSIITIPVIMGLKKRLG